MKPNGGNTQTAVSAAQKSERWSGTRRASAFALAGLAVVVLTPFVFFPEIMGDVGVTHASTLRNVSAAVVLLLGAAAMLVGLGSLGRQFLKRL